MKKCFLSVFFLSLFSVTLHATSEDVLVESVQREDIAITKDQPSPKSQTRTHKTSKAWEDICETSKNAVIQILTFAKSPNILEPFRSPDRPRWRGSGFFIQPAGCQEGYILSNFHVVEEKELCFMQLPALSKERFLLDVVGSCPEKDFALLKLGEKDCETIKQLLKVKQLPYLKLGNADTLVEGEEIMVLGYPLGMENFKSSKGIVSGRESSEKGESIQTTVPTNPGNSGGPAVDITGEVVGISFSHATRAGTEVEGIAFLIPINNVTLYLEQLKKEKILRVPFWGFEYHPTTSFELARWKAPADGGIYLKKVYTASLFEEAGLCKNDIVYQVNNITIDRFGLLNAPWGTSKVQLLDYLNRLDIGSKVTIVAYRGGERKETSVTVKMRTPFKIDTIYSTYEALPPYEVIGGLVVSELSLNHLKEFIERYRRIIDPSEDETAAFLRYAEPNKRHESRLIISSVLPDSQGDKTRCFENTLDRIISQVNDTPVKTIQDFRDAVRKSKDTASLKITTEGGTMIELSLADIVAEEEILRERNEFYPKSKLIEELERALAWK